MTEIWVLMWSKEQQAFHFETFAELQQEGQQLFDGNLDKPNDYSVIFSGTEESVREEAKARTGQLEYWRLMKRLTA